MTLEMTEAIRNTEELIKQRQEELARTPTGCYTLRAGMLGGVKALLELKGRLALRQVKQ